MKPFKLTLFFLLLLFAFVSQAQSTCDTLSCVVKKAGSYKVELERKCSDKIHIYVYDAKGVALKTTPVLGYVSYFYHDDTYFVEDLYQHPGTNALEAAIPCPGFYNFKVSLIINRESVSVHFENECTLRALANYESYY